MLKVWLEINLTVEPKFLDKRQNYITPIWRLKTRGYYSDKRPNLDLVFKDSHYFLDGDPLAFLEDLLPFRIYQKSFIIKTLALAQVIYVLILGGLFIREFDSIESDIRLLKNYNCLSSFGLAVSVNTMTLPEISDIIGTLCACV